MKGYELPMSKKIIIGVIGAGSADAAALNIAGQVGRLIGERGAVLLCGGLSGVMEAAARGAKSAGGTTVGVLPQSSSQFANPYIDIPIATGFGEGRNVVIVNTADVLIAISGEYGTLSEIALALKSGKKVVGISTWGIPGVVRAADAADAVEKAFSLVNKGLEGGD
jgi:uncharacterized protein (TIGR00725 family)